MPVSMSLWEENERKREWKGDAIDVTVILRLQVFRCIYFDFDLAAHCISTLSLQYTHTYSQPRSTIFSFSQYSIWIFIFSSDSFFLPRAYCYTDIDKKINEEFLPRIYSIVMILLCGSSTFLLVFRISCFLLRLLNALT